MPYEEKESSAHCHLRAIPVSDGFWIDQEMWCSHGSAGLHLHRVDGELLKH